MNQKENDIIQQVTIIILDANAGMRQQMQQTQPERKWSNESTGVVRAGPLRTDAERKWSNESAGVVRAGPLSTDPERKWSNESAGAVRAGPVRTVGGNESAEPVQRVRSRTVGGSESSVQGGLVKKPPPPVPHRGRKPQKEANDR